MEINTQAQEKNTKFKMMQAGLTRDNGE